MKTKQPSKLMPLPKLPEGTRIGERPAGIDFMTRGGERWFAIIEHLKVLDPQATIQINVLSCSKTKINGIKGSIKHAARKLGFTKVIKFAIQGDTLHIWSNN